jgi:hypothetical protein|tara:strand:- start:321 stop:578 length:258 start_codon:yes stop_codon:yes gene_type:complete
MYSLNSDSQPQDDREINALSITDTGMTILWDLVIAPMADNLTEEDQNTISLIGLTFKMVADKAYAYEKMMGQVPSEETLQDFSRN